MVTTRVCYWHLVGEARGTARHPTLHRTENCLAQDVSSAEVEKTSCKSTLSFYKGSKNICLMNIVNIANQIFFTYKTLCWMLSHILSHWYPVR